MSRSETSETFDTIGVTSRAQWWGTGSEAKHGREGREGGKPSTPPPPPPDVEPFAVFWDFLTSVKQVTFESHYVNSQRLGYLSSLPDFGASAHGHANHLDHLSRMSHGTFLVGTRSFLADLSAVATEWSTVTVCCSRCPLDKLSKYIVASLLVQYQLRQVISDIYSNKIMPTCTDTVSDMCW
ncbi:hypothetical protein NEUTE1DRAFT_111329 [Neurospora tetrasperma FGSC 2508]|uniref:Uncharacterized protein n=1 Tax=Neurospora tetrasperma (strain FGSC 2508 / ATCC MYA-4615 / P0657) TaxID=510951 RepID=F8MRP3_NEUT8|nr:uncharacterized protein NEUTE1DRAFT_111329 [Neurospora tetrasperma FGSC 2508]EGO56944.1 hypothetical protein NEUTE1DRAFT_111329 [Neurospora tetrasperma FGSC 2508]EGZ70154.1 hypothetical protein NEUTE2DRAFT_130176 [Neurospora tetrasperma FGSC 2509]